MKRFWIQLPDKKEVFTIDNTNNEIELYESSTEHNYNLVSGDYTLDSLIKHLVGLGIDARFGEIKSDKNSNFIVLFLEDTYDLVQGKFIESLSGIESVDNGDRLDENVTFPTT